MRGSGSISIAKSIFHLIVLRGKVPHFKFAEVEGKVLAVELSLSEKLACCWCFKGETNLFDGAISQGAKER